MADWNKRLRAARQELGLGPGDLAARAGLSEASVRAYEMGRRHPTREHLSRILDCLRLDRQTRNELLVDAGLAPDALDPHDGSLSLREAIRLVHDRPWPAFVLNDVMEIIAGSRSGMWLAGLTHKDLGDRVERNVLVIAAKVVAATEHMGDWGRIARRAIARMKAAGIGTLGDPDPYFAAILDRIARVGAGLTREFAQQWDETPAEAPQVMSWSYSAQWTIRESGTLRLHCMAMRVNAHDPIEIHDFVPADAKSAAMLERVAAARSVR